VLINTNVPPNSTQQHYYATSILVRASDDLPFHAPPQKCTPQYAK
jgi:hypothetical protein